MPGPVDPGHCGSIEHTYIRRNDENTSDGARPIPPNEHRARIVQEVWCRLPIMPHLVLRAEYPQRFASGRYHHGQIGAARRLHISIADYERHLMAAFGRVWDRFEGKE